MLSDEGRDRVDIRINDELIMKKKHPCGGNRFVVLRVGMDFKLRCVNCSREVMMPRRSAEKSIRQVYRDGEKLDVSAL